MNYFAYFSYFSMIVVIVDMGHPVGTEAIKIDELVRVNFMSCNLFSLSLAQIDVM